MKCANTRCRSEYVERLDGTDKIAVTLLMLESLVMGDLPRPRNTSIHVPKEVVNAIDTLRCQSCEYVTLIMEGRILAVSEQPVPISKSFVSPGDSHV